MTKLYQWDKILFSLLLLIFTSCKKSEKTYYPDGKLRSITELNKDGLPDGWQSFYYPNGQLKEETNFTNGNENGKSIGYFEDGSIMYESFFKEGLLQGTLKLYHRNGKLESEQFYKKNKKHGICKGFYASGRLEYEVFYEYGDLQYSERYDSTGALISKFHEILTNLDSGDYILNHAYPYKVWFSEYKLHKMADLYLKEREDDIIETDVLLNGETNTTKLSGIYIPKKLGKYILSIHAFDSIDRITVFKEIPITVVDKSQN